MDSKIIAVIAVAVVAVAGVGGYMVLSGNSGSSGGSFTFDDSIQMMVFGNVNNDSKLDNADADALQIMLDNKTFESSKHPYADANRDGKVDASDVSYIKDLAAQKEGTVAYYYNTIDSRIDSVKLPLNNICIVGTPCCTAALVLDIVDKIVGVHDTNNWDEAFSDLKAKDKVSDLNTGAAGLNMELFSKVSEKTAGGVGAVVTTASMGSTYYPEDELKAVGVPSVKMAFGTSYDLNAYATFGFLIGASERANEYLDLVNSVYAKATDVIAKAKADNYKVPVTLAMFGSPGMGGGFVNVTESQDVANIIAAGGVIADGVPDNGTKDPEEGVWIYDMKADVGIISCQGMTYTSSDAWWSKINTIVDGMTQLKSLDCVPENTYLVNRNIPNICQVAYYLELFYPDYVEAGYGDKVNQTWIDNYYSSTLSGYDVTEHRLFFKMTELDA